HVLPLDRRREFLVHNLGEVIVELCSREVVEDFFPVGLLAAVVTQVRRDLPAQEAHTRGLADSVWTEQANDFPFLRDREAEETKRVLSVLMYEIFFQRFGEPHNPNCVERTFADADSAIYARLLAARGLRGFR